MLNQTIEEFFFHYLSVLTGKPFKSVRDLEVLSARALLRLIDVMDDQLLGLFIHIIKQSNKKEIFFDKLMGQHDEDNRTLVDSFFDRYMKLVMAEDEETHYYNPLTYYLSADTFEDLAYIQSRQAFFTRQTHDTINQYILETFKEPVNFKAGEQEKAWTWFWDKIVGP